MDDNGIRSPAIEGLHAVDGAGGSGAVGAGRTAPPLARSPVGHILVARGLRDFGDSLVAVLLPAYLVALGFGAAEVGAVATIALLGSALMTLGMGAIGTRADPRRLLLLAALLMVATGLCFAAAVTFTAIVAVALVGTINPSAGSVSVFAPLEQAVLTGASADARRTAVFARYSLVGALAAAVGVPKLAAFRSVFLLYALLGAACLLAYRAIPSLPASDGNGPGAGWYKDIGGSMGAALNTAAAMDAYTLSDRGTWLNFGNRRDLVVVVEGDRQLFNQYGVMLVNPARYPTVKAGLGQRFIDWLIAPEGQAAIAGYRINGEQLFFPDVDRPGL